MEKTPFENVLADSTKHSVTVAVREPTSNEEAAATFIESMAAVRAMGVRYAAKWQEQFDAELLAAIKAD